MSRCIHYISLSSLRKIITDPAHGMTLAYVNSPRQTFGELSCQFFVAGDDKREDAARGLTLGKRGMWESCLQRQNPDAVDLLNP